MLRTFLKKILPWLVAGAIFAYLFHQYPPQKIYNSLKLMNIPLFCLVGISYFLLMYLLDTFSITRILNHFGHEGTLRELLPARGLTYLIMVVNYAAGQAAFALYQNKRHGLPISEMFGIFGIIVVIDLMLLATLAYIATFFTAWPFEVLGMNIGQFVRLFTVTCYALLILNIMFWRGSLGKIGFLEKFRQKDFFSVLVRAHFTDYLCVFLLRLPVHIFIICGMFIAIKTFRAHIPFTSILANIPLIFFIGALPITPGGLGSSNVALVELFKPFITSRAITSGIVTAGDLLFSFSLMWMFINYLMKAVTGLICLKFVSKDLFQSDSVKKLTIGVNLPT